MVLIQNIHASMGAHRLLIIKRIYLHDESIRVRCSHRTNYICKHTTSESPSYPELLWKADTFEMWAKILWRSISSLRNGVLFVLALAAWVAYLRGWCAGVGGVLVWVPC